LSPWNVSLILLEIRGDTWNLRFDLKLFDLKCRLDLTPVPYPLGCAKQFFLQSAPLNDSDSHCQCCSDEE